MSSITYESNFTSLSSVSLDNSPIQQQQQQQHTDVNLPCTHITSSLTNDIVSIPQNTEEDPVNIVVPHILTVPDNHGALSQEEHTQNEQEEEEPVYVVFDVSSIPDKDSIPDVTNTDKPTIPDTDTDTDTNTNTNTPLMPTLAAIDDVDVNSCYKWYAKIKEVVSEIDVLNLSIDIRLNELKTTYASLIKSNHKKIFLFCLDSFYFQYRVLHMEQDNLTRLFLTTKNQIYGDYFKLYGIMTMQLKDLFHVDTKVLNINVNKYTMYDDLDTLAEYTPAMVNDLFVEIDRVLQILYTHYKTQKIIRDAHLAETHIGFTITSFLNTIEHENDMIHRKWLLYRNFLENFCNSQYEYLIKLRARYELLVNEIRNEVLHECDDKSNII